MLASRHCAAERQNLSVQLGFIRVFERQSALDDPAPSVRCAP